MPWNMHLFAWPHEQIRCVYIYIYIWMVYVYIYKYVYECSSRAIYLSIYPSIHLSIYMSMILYIYTHMYVFIHVWNQQIRVHWGPWFRTSYLCPGCLRQLLCQGNLLCQDLGPSQVVPHILPPYDQKLGWKMTNNWAIPAIKKTYKNHENKQRSLAQQKDSGTILMTTLEGPLSTQKTPCSSHVWDFVRSHVHGIDDRRLRGLWQEHRNNRALDWSQCLKIFQYPLVN